MYFPMFCNLLFCLSKFYVFLFLLFLNPTIHQRSPKACLAIRLIKIRASLELRIEKKNREIGKTHDLDGYGIHDCKLEDFERIGFNHFFKGLPMNFSHKIKILQDS